MGKQLVNTEEEYHYPDLSNNPGAPASKRG
jgi:hypothetical protein